MVISSTSGRIPKAAPRSEGIYLVRMNRRSGELQQVSGGALMLDQVVSTEGDWPRNFSLDPSGRWLLVANQRSDSVVVFGRDPENGRLTPTRPPQRIAIPSPVCLRFA